MPEPGLNDTESLIVADLLRRQKVGTLKYGTTVAANPLPLREWLQHQYEELLDAAIYCRRAIQEIDREKHNRNEPWLATYEGVAHAREAN